MPSAVILAGGRSRRMGADKASVIFRGKPLIMHVYERTAKIFDKIFFAVSKANENLTKNLPGETVVDELPSVGPIAGIHSGLSAISDEWAFVTGCDTPFAEEKFLRRIVSEYRGEDALVPVAGEFLQPLHSIYNRRLVPRIEKYAAEGGTAIFEFLKSINVRYIDGEEFSETFFNINTKKALKEADDIAELKSIVS